jgi:hypothetical protein
MPGFTHPAETTAGFFENMITSCEKLPNEREKYNDLIFLFSISPMLPDAAFSTITKMIRLGQK